MTKLHSLFDAYIASLYQRSLLVPDFLTRHSVAIAAIWVALAGCAALVRLALSATPIHNVGDAMPILIAYSAVIIAPLCGFMLARCAFGGKKKREPLDFHLSFFGKWRRINHEDAAKNPLFGPVGFLASLLIGLMLNVFVRSAEFFVAVPAMSAHAPDWGLQLFAIMTIDLVIMNFFYMVAFVMALRSVPLFPRMLLYVWSLDVFMQLVIASYMSQIYSLPNEVVAPLVSLLQGNITKVLISVAVWLPYLIMSQRVNLTYRSRVPA